MKSVKYFYLKRETKLYLTKFQFMGVINNTFYIIHYKNSVPIKLPT